LKFEKLTIFTATETYGHDDNCTALDYAIPALESAMDECKVLDYSTEEFKLVPKQQQEEHGQEAQAERLRATAHGLLDQLDKMDEMYDAATAQRDALLKTAQAMYELHKDGVSHQLQAHQREAALTALHAAIATATGEKE
jgi:hypothetical protein